MMRDSRRRSSPQAESSRRRRRDRERDREKDRDQKSSRDQPSTTTADRAVDTPDYDRSSRRTNDDTSYSRGKPSQDRDRAAPIVEQDTSANVPKPWMGDNPNYYTAEPDPIPHSSRQYRPQPRSQRQTHTRALSSSGSDSSSVDYLDISRRYDTSRFGGALSAFFRAPSEHRRQQRRVKNKAKKRAVFPFNNSSSSSLNSDLAYGEGYIPQSKSSSRRSRSDVRHRNESGDPFQPGKLQRRQTDEEIVAIGRQLSDLAKRQNEEDLRASGRNRPSKIFGAAAGLATLSELRKSKKDSIRGIGSSKPAGRHSDDEDWESASDDDDSSDDNASALAYGASKTNLPGVLGGAAAAAAGAGALWASQSGRRTSGQQRPGVDPSLFGPVNSLNGMVTPVPFEDKQRYGNGYDPRREAPSQVTDSVDNVPMRQVYPVPTSRPDQFDARHSASLPGSRADDLPQVARPGPAPIQAPVPIAPVSSKVYDAQSLEDTSRREDRERRRARDDEPRAMSSTAKFGFGTAATAVVAAAALQSRHQRGRDEDYRSYEKVAPKKLVRGERSDYERRRSDRDHEMARDLERESKRERERQREREREKERERERESRKSKGSSSKTKEERDSKRSSRYDDLDDITGKRSDIGKDRERRSSKRDKDEIKVEYDDDKSSRRSRREEKMPADRDLTRDIATGAVIAGGAALAAGALASGSSASVPERPLTPAVFTVDREPSFDDWPPRSPSPDVRLSRKDSFEMEKMVEDSTRQGTRSSHDYEDTQSQAKSIYDEAKKATVPVGAAAVAAAVAAETTRGRERGRDRHRDNYSDDGSRERTTPVKDAVQEEADRYYREAEAARKIAEEEARSRSRSKGRDQGDEPPEIAIVTPPGYEEDKKLDKSPYDAPNADVRIDHQIYPAETHRFRSAEGDLDAPVWKSRDPSCERERPLLNLVLPTPIPSREPTPAPEPDQRSRSSPSDEPEKSDKSDKKDKKDKKKDKKKGKKSKDRDQPADIPKPGVDVVIGPKGDIIETPSTPKSVTWGENETKSYEIESPEHERKDPIDKERPRLNKASKWGILAAAIAGSSTEPDNEPEPVSSDVSKTRDGPSGSRDRAFDDAVGDPPIPGPKPGSTESKQMPGGFADDVEFAGTLAAGLEDAGFDPNIVVNDPAYRRRDSPPGSDELHDSGFYKKAFSETVEDLGKSGEPMTPGSGFVIGETATPKDEGADEWGEVPVKMSKKEKRKQEKAAAAKRQSMDFEESAPPESIETQTTESLTEIPLSKKEQKKRAKAAKSRALAGDDDWEVAGQGTETPPSQTQGTETPPSWEAGEDDWEAPSSKKKKGKNRKSKDYSELDNDKVSVPIDSFNEIQSSKDTNPEDEWDLPKKKKKGKSSSPDSPSQSAPASEASSEVGSKKKSKRRSMHGDDFSAWDGDPPDKRRVDPFEERDVSSVVSEPRYDDRRRDSKSKRSSRYDDDDDTKSIASAPGGSRKSKDSEKRSSGIFSSIFSKSNGHKDDDSKKESFLDNAGTLGAGVGLAGAAAVIAAASSRQHATEASSETEQPVVEGFDTGREIEQSPDPEIVHRVIKPAIDPQYGDLLPLPPSEPGSPVEAPEELPELPDSRPDTPPEERNLRAQERMVHVRRRSAQDLPVKSPSRTAIPIQLRLGARASPSSPGMFKSSPLNSPGTPDSAGPHKRAARPTSWDSSRGPIPLQLPRHVRHGSTDAAISDADQPAPVGSRDLPAAVEGLADASAISNDQPATESQPLHIDIGELAAVERELAGSQESTPKAEIKPEFPAVGTEPSTLVDEQVATDAHVEEPAHESSQADFDPEPIDPMSKNRSSYLLNSTPSSTRTDRSIDPETLAQSPPQETPSKQRMLGADLSDIPEDLTSADEHFTDARDSQSEDDFFEEARSALSSEVSSRGEEPATVTTPTRATFAETAPAATPTPADSTPAGSDHEWDTPASKKKSKKAKKKAAKAAAAASASSPWDTAVEDDSMMSTPLAGPSVTGQGLGLEADIPSVAVSAPDVTVEPRSDAASRDLEDSQSAPLQPDSIESASFAADEHVDDSGFAAAPSKKDKRKKKKEKKQKQADDAFEPSSEQHISDEFKTDRTKDVDGYYPSAAGLHGAKASADSPAAKTESHGYFPSAARVMPVAVPAAVAAGLALKDHWDQAPADDRGAGKNVVHGEHAGDFEQSTHETPLDVVKDRAPVDTYVSEPLFSQGGEPAEDSQNREASFDTSPVIDEPPKFESEAPTSTEDAGDDEWSSLVTSKKSKKNRKKKAALASIAAHEEEPVPLDRSLESQEESAVGPSAETSADPAQSDPTTSSVPDIGGDEWASTTVSKKKGKKNKKKQASAFSWDEPESTETPAPDEESPAPAFDAHDSWDLEEPSTEMARQLEDIPESPEQPEIAGDEAAQPAAEDAEDEWAALTAPKKSKKAQKKDAFEFPSWDEEVALGSASRDVADARQADEQPQNTDTKADPSSADEPALGHSQPETSTQETQAEDEWAAPKSSKAKKKDKKKKRQTVDFAAEEEPQPEPHSMDLADETRTTVAPMEQPTLTATEAPAAQSCSDDTVTQRDLSSTSEPDAIPEPVPEVTQAMASEHVDEWSADPPAAQPADSNEPSADDWAPATKKGKKSKKNKKSTLLAWDEEPAPQAADTAVPPPETTAEPAVPAADPEDEFEVPKKKKKGKKGKSIAAFDDWADSPTDKQAPSTQTDNATPAVEGSIAPPEPALEPVQDAPNADKALESAGPQVASEGLSLLTGRSAQEFLAEDPLAGNDVETPASGALFAVNDLASPLKPGDFTLPLGSLQEASEPSALDATNSESAARSVEDAQYQPASTTPEQVEQTPAEADDSEFLFPMKKTKGKKGKKGKRDVEPYAIPSADPTMQETDLAPENAVKIDVVEQGEGEVPQPSPTEALDPSLEPTIEPSADIAPAPDDQSDFGFVAKPSKKDKKKKKSKALAFNEAVAEAPAKEPIERGSTDDSTEQQAPSVTENAPDLAQAEDPETLATEAEAQPEAQPDDEWAAPATSKKDKKKKKKLAAAGWADDISVQEDAANNVTGDTPSEDGPAQPQDSTFVDDWATPALSKKDKKKKKKQAALDWTQEESSQFEPSSAEPSAPTDTAAAHETELPTETDAPGQSSQAIAEPEAPPADDEWGMPALSKKDKKKKKKQAELDWADESSTPKETESVPETPLSVAEAPGDDWGSPALSKKDKKKKKKAAAMAWDDDVQTAPQTSAAEETIASETTPAGAEQAADEPPSAEDSREASEAQADDKTSAPHDDSGLPSASIDDPEPEYGFSLSKKDKKKKKKAKAAAAVGWNEDEPAVASEGPDRSVETPTANEFFNYQARGKPDDGPSSWQAATEHWSAEPNWEDPEPPREEDEDSWDVTATKSKNKKKKKTSAADPDTSGNTAAKGAVSVPQDVVAAPLEFSAPPSAAADAEDEWDALVFKTKPEKHDEDDFPWAQPRSTGQPDDPALKAVVPEDIATVDDLRQVLSGSGPEKEKSEPQRISESSQETDNLDTSQADHGRDITAETDQPDATATGEDAAPTAQKDSPKDLADSQENKDDVTGGHGAGENALDVEDLDAWTAPAKLSKKDKKKKKKQQQAMSWDEATDEAQPTDQSTEPAQDIPTEAENREVSQEPPHVQSEAQETQETQSSRPIPEFDDWAPKKLSKKDKKKAEKAARLAALEMDEPPSEQEKKLEPESATETIPTVEASTETASGREDQLGEAPAAADVGQSGFDEWTPQKLSKKDKKRAEKAARLSALEAAEPPPAQDTEWEPEPATEATLATETSTEPASLPEDHEYRPEEVPEPMDEAQSGFDEWAPKLSKKDKKKAEKAARLAALAADEPVSEEVKEPELAIEDAPAAEREANIAASTDEPPAEETQPEFEEWAPKLSKKDKKKAEKAARLAAIAADEPQSQDADNAQPIADVAPVIEPVPQTFEDLAAETPAAAEEAEAEIDEWAPKMSKKDKKKAEKAARLAASETAESSAEPATAEVTAQAESVAEPISETHTPSEEQRTESSAVPVEEAQPEVDEWAPTLSKKDKKKAEKAARLAALSSTDNITENSEPPVAADTSDPQPEAGADRPLLNKPDEDDWAPKLSKKDKKKKAKAAQFATFDAFDAVSEDKTEAPPKSQETDQPLDTLETSQSQERSDIEGVAAPKEPVTEDPQPVDDEWAPKLSKKDKKKKAKAAQLASFDLDQTVPDSTTEASGSQTPVQLPEEGPSVQQESQADDEWAPKLSKKDKKKKEKAAQFADLAPEEPANETPREPEQLQEPEELPKDGSAAIGDEDPVPADILVEPIAEDEWAPKLSKKDKKKKAKAAQLGLTELETPTDSTAEPPTEEPETLALQETDRSQEPPREESTVADKTSAPEQQQPAEDEWAPKLSKKDKKKKGKAAQFEAFNDDEAQGSAPEVPSGQAAASPEEVVNVSEDAAAQDPPPEEDEWAPKLSKKDKKKKAKATQFAAFDVEEPAPEPLPTGDIPTVEEQQSELDEWAPKLSKKDKKKAEKAARLAALDVPETSLEIPDVSEKTPTEGPSAALEEDLNQEQQQPEVDTWAPTMSKKDKKKAEKAARLAAMAMEDSPASIADSTAMPAEEVTSTATEKPISEQPVDEIDEWSPPMSKKDKKKAEKAARLAALSVEDPVMATSESSAPLAEDAPAVASEDVTKQEAAPESSLEASGEIDEWAPKMSKKDKKKADKAARLAALTVDEAEPAEGPVAEEVPIASTEQSEPASVPQEAEPDFDDWAPKKMSKKDKKKADKLARSAQPITEDPVNDSTPSDTMAEDVHKPDGSSVDATSIEAQADFDDWAPKPTSKKDKKKAEKLARAAALSAGLAVAGGAIAGSGDNAENVEKPAPETGVMESAKEQQTDTTDGSHSSSARDFNAETSTLVPEPGQSQDVNFPSEPPAEEFGDSLDTSRDGPAEDAAPRETVPEDTEWALPVKKKGKKGKKNLIATFDPAAEETSSATQDTPSEGVTRDVEIPQEDVVSAAPETQDASEDFWAVPTKASKKAKKGKTKVSQEATPTETPRASSPVSFEPRLEPESAPADRAWEEPVEPAPVVEEDEWAMPVKSSKKSKKDKKKASQDPTPTETPRAMSPSWDDKADPGVDSPAHQDLAEEPAPASLQADDWGAEFSTPASKKKNKKKGKSSLVFGAVPDPPTNQSATSAQQFGQDDDTKQTDPEATHEKQESTDAPYSTPEDTTYMQASEHDATRDGTSESKLDQVKMPQGPGFGSMATDTSLHDAALDEQDKSQHKSEGGLGSEIFERDSGSYEQAPREPREFENAEPTDVTSQEPTTPGQGPGFGALGAAAAATAVGAAAVSEKSAGGKKKKGSKKKKVLDKRTARDDDIFDDPALWEGADKKGLDDVAVPQETEDFWAADEPEVEETKKIDDSWDQGGSTNQEQEQEQEQEKTRAALPTPNSDSPASESGWKETARQGARLDDDFEESPVLGRGESDPRRVMGTSLLRLASDASEQETSLLPEDNHARSLTSDRLSDSPDFKRSPNRGLPVVQEVPETEAETSRDARTSLEINRDSGFVTDSPHPSDRRSKTFDDIREEPQRDSGVHTEDWDEPAPHTPANRWEHKLRRSPQSTPRLREPLEQAATPEPEKRQSKNYGSLLGDQGSTPSRGISGPGAAAAAALAAGAMASRSGGRDSDPRSVSESHTTRLQQAQDASPSPSATSQQGERTLRRTASNTSIVRQRTPEPLKFRPESPGIRSTPTPPLRRVNRRISSELPPRETNTPKPVANETKVRVRDKDKDKDKDKDMTDVYDGFGEGRIGSPRSPTRPHSMRRRQSMQVLELESKVEQLIAENRLLSDARNHAEQNLSQRATSVLSERDAEIENLKQSLQFLQNEVSRLTEVNAGLTSANAELASKDNARYAGLEPSSGDGSRGLDLAAGGAAGAAAGAAATAASYQQSIQEKDDEIADLRAQLEDAKEQVREMQRQILASKAGDAQFLELLDEDHFDHRCQQLCSHVQQWVLRFSKFSDMRACRLTSEINDEKTIDRLDNAVLDGSDVDVYLNDRVRRRDIFMSMTMNMIWEFVFTRYLFGMDREQRQKLKSLEKLLIEVGPAQAVRQWRAVTLTLLARRDSFKQQRDLDTEAVVQAIYQTLCKILPPPSNLEGQIQSQLRRVMAEAVALSIQMRTQKAEYMMLPPLQPEYDADGELAASVYFNASMMNERSGSSAVSNEELEAQQAKVRIVLFPLVVKKGDDSGVGDEEIVVCPAQVVVARSASRRSMAPSSDAGGASLGGAPSRVSVVTEHMT